MKAPSPLTVEQQELVEEHIYLTKWFVYYFVNHNDAIVGLSTEDLHQEAAVALCKAASAYDGRNVQFKSFAITVMRNHLMEYCSNIALGTQRLPQTSLDAVITDADLPSLQNTLPCSVGTFEDDFLSNTWTSEFLEQRKHTYQGCAKLGIEALQLKILDGYGVTDIASLYGTKPNLVGAWISKAIKKIREDVTTAELSTLDVEKVLPFP